MKREATDTIVPAQETLPKDGLKFIKKYLGEKAGDIQDSPERIRDRILEHLAESDKQIRKLLEKANASAATRAKALLKRPPLPAALKRADLPAIAPLDQSPPTDDLALGMPRLVSINGLLDSPALRGGSMDDLIRALTVPAVKAPGYPTWGAAQWSHPDRVFWAQWTSTSAFRAMCLANCIGGGVWQEEALTNAARWRWFFSAQATEPLQIFTAHEISGPCVWRTDGGFVSLWLMAETTVEKYVGGGIWQVIGKDDRSIRKLYSSNSSLALNGPPPQGHFGGAHGSSVSFSGTDNGVAITAEAGRLHTIGVDVTLALTANMGAAIAVGELAGSYLDLCKLSVPSCTICRTG